MYMIRKTKNMILLPTPFFNALSILLILIIISSTTINGEENTMSALKNSILKTQNTDTEFSLSGEYCLWTGIHCDNYGSVLSINWMSRALSGYFPPSLSNLTSLNTLFLNNNSFYGSIPSLSNLTSLEAVDFSDNNFNTISPDAFCGLTSLNYLSLSNNPQLSSWEFPYELIGSVNLMTFSAGNDNLGGYIPEFLGSFKSLQNLDISHNKMTGTIPTFLTSLPDLATINVSYNKFQGEMPLFRREVLVSAFGNKLDDKSVNRYRKKIDLRKVVAIVLSIVVGTILLAAVVFFVRSTCWKKRSHNGVYANDVEAAAEKSTGGPLEIYTCERLRKATNNFSNTLGSGGYGCVYKGVLNGKQVAVKCLKNGKGRREILFASFQTEVEALSRAHHPNLVKLFGYYSEPSKKEIMLVYEYLSNRSLDMWIFKGDDRLGALNWATKKKIMLEIAKGLRYLHEELSNKTRILHRDIKPENVVLDEKFTAKLCDFGLAKFFSKDKTSTNTAPRGTRGYLAPELVSHHKRTEKSDVYSYGVVVIETLLEKKNLNNYSLLVNGIKSKLKDGEKLLSIFTDLIEDRKRCSDMLKKTKEMEKIVLLALQCVDDNPTARPSMSKVIEELEKIV